MTVRRKKKNNSIKILVVIAVVLILLLIVLVVVSRKTKSGITPEQLEKANIKYQEEKNQEIKAELYEKSEQERMQYYCANFFKLIDSNNYEKAYELLYKDYQENYFPTLNSFSAYLKEYFPSDFALSYNNIERLGDIYVLMVSVRDTVNGSYGHNFDMYVVLKENALNDYDISFSRNSAVGKEE